MALFGKDLGIDLGTTNTLICEAGEIVLQEPTVVAIDTIDELRIVEGGRAARGLAGRGPQAFPTPLRRGIWASISAAVFRRRRCYRSAASWRPTPCALGDCASMRRSS